MLVLKQDWVVLSMSTHYVGAMHLGLPMYINWGEAGQSAPQKQLSLQLVNIEPTAYRAVPYSQNVELEYITSILFCKGFAR